MVEDVVNGAAWGRGCVLCTTPDRLAGGPVAPPAPSHDLRSRRGGIATEPTVGQSPLAYADDELVAFVAADLPGVLVAPRAHVEGLGRMPGFAGAFLGALRRAVTVVQSAYGAEGAMVEPTIAVPGAAGHVCYRVVASLPGGGAPSVPAPDPATVAAHLAEALEDRFVPR